MATSPEDGTKTKPNARKQDKKPTINKRRCIGSACLQCKKRKSKCDGGLPSCAACAIVYGTSCEYDLTSDHRRKGVYKKDIKAKSKPDTLQTLIEAILNLPEDEAFDLVRRLRTCENLEDVASEVQAEAQATDAANAIDNGTGKKARGEDSDESDHDPDASLDPLSANIQRELSDQLGHMRLDDGTIHFLGGTSNLRFAEHHDNHGNVLALASKYTQNEDIVRSWTNVTTDVDLILHLLQLYFTWHYPSFVTLSKSLFFRDFFRGRPSTSASGPEYCTPLLVNAMLALGCHFTTWPRARGDPSDYATAGDHFFREAKRLIVENEEFENPKLATVQALALMSVREAGCGREAKGWVYSGMSFRMACDLGLNIKLTMDQRTSHLSDEDLDAQRITFWGCYQFDKCWSNYLGRPPQLAKSIITVPKFDVFPEEDAETWSPRNDSGIDKTNAQPARTRAVALQMSTLCEISEDLLATFYSPTQPEKPLSKAAEVKRLSDFHTRLEAWLKHLPKEMEAKEGQLPYILVMHMFFHLLYIHLFRPFLKHTRTSSPLPPEVSPRKLCTQAALKISKLLRLYKKTYGLKQICNIVVYIAHSACSIHLLNLPEKEAKRDISYGVRQLEEIAEFWPCASRTLSTLAVQVRRWKIALSEDIAAILDKWEMKYKIDHASPALLKDSPGPASPIALLSTSAAYMKPIPAISVGGIIMTPAVDSPLSTAQTVQSPITQQFAVPQRIHHAPEIPDVANQTSGNWTSSRVNQSFVQRPEIRSSLKRPAPTALYSGVDSLFEENKDWWYKDQSTFYEHWSRRDSLVVGDISATISSAGAGSSANGQNDSMQVDSSLNVLDGWHFQDIDFTADSYNEV